MEPDAAVEASQAGPSLLDVMASAGEWAVALIALLDPATRSTLSQTSTGLYQWVWEASPQATVTLLAYTGLTEEVWKQRMARAEHGLALRGPHRSNKLVLRLPTPNPEALQPILSVSQGVGRAVTELEVHQSFSWTSPTEGVRAPWLKALPAAFPNLRTLRINRLCGCLPPPAQLPHLRDLHVTLVEQTESRDPACTPDQICTSIAPYLAQITALSLLGDVPYGGLGIPWAKVFSGVTHTLTHLTKGGIIDQSLVQLLSTRAPALVRVSAESLYPAENEIWPIRELCIDCTDGEVHLHFLPLSLQGVTLLPDKWGRLRCRLCVSGPEVRGTAYTHAHTHTHMRRHALYRHATRAHTCVVAHTAVL